MATRPRQAPMSAPAPHRSRTTRALGAACNPAPPTTTSRWRRAAAGPPTGPTAALPPAPCEGRHRRQPTPTVVTSPASSISATVARLNGTADPNGASTSAWFEWGTSTAYGNTTALNNVGSGTSPVSYNALISAPWRAAPLTTSARWLRTAAARPMAAAAALPPAPVRHRRQTVVTSAASSIGETAARLNGTADPNGASTSAWFQWGTSTAYGNTTALDSVGSGTSPVSYNALIWATWSAAPPTTSARWRRIAAGPPMAPTAALPPAPVRLNRCDTSGAGRSDYGFRVRDRLQRRLVVERKSLDRWDSGH